MKFSNVRIEPEGLRPEDAAAFIGVSARTLDACRQAGWIKPSVQLKRLTIYRPASLRLLLNRIEAEGLPPERRCPNHESLAAV
jgi:hypothetical protein